jgi:hypothetical protein
VPYPDTIKEQTTFFIKYCLIETVGHAQRRTKIKKLKQHEKGVERGGEGVWLGTISGLGTPDTPDWR